MEHAWVMNIPDKIVDFGLKPFHIFDVWLDDVEVESIVAELW